MAKSELIPWIKRLHRTGELFEGKYRIERGLGTGSFAIVVKARHEVMGREVALKFLKPEVVRSNPEVSERFVKEVQIVSRLRHPNTVTIFDFGQVHIDRLGDDVAYMVLEYVEGKTLDVYIDSAGAFDAPRAVHVTRQVLKSLAEAHAHGIIHRDLKPSNIMLTELHGERDFVKVLDFGVAKLLEDAEPRAERFEPRSTQFIGTPVYMSPEQVVGREVGPASDVYSLGLIFYEMLTGEAPIDSDNVATVARLHLSDEPLPFPSIDALPHNLRRIILKATSREPDDRFPDVESFARALPGGSARSVELVAAEASVELVEVEASEADDELGDVFSGRGYVDVIEPDQELEARRRRTASTPDGGQPVAKPASRAQSSSRHKRRPRPSPRPDKLDIDVASVERQKRQLERRAEPSGPSHRVSGQYETREIVLRVVIYLAGAASGYVGFVVLTAAMVGYSPTTRLIGGLLLPVAAVLWAVFSAVRAVGDDVARRLLLPTAKNLVYLLGIVLVVCLLAFPEPTIGGLQSEATWFLSGLPPTPPWSWLVEATESVASTLAGGLDAVDRILPF